MKTRDAAAFAPRERHAVVLRQSLLRLITGFRSTFRRERHGTAAHAPRTIAALRPQPRRTTRTHNALPQATQQAH
eukprot:9685173-Alexandrium_andersonii.AAC.1